MADLGSTVVAGVLVAALAGMLWMVWWVLVALVVPGWSPVVISSGSMAPHIRPGDVVIAGVADSALLTAGAVIVFDDPNHGLVTHRISRVEPDGTLRTKGDANRDEDSDGVTPSAVLGRGRLLLPAVGRPLLWLHEGVWFPLVMLIVGSVAAVLYVRAWWRATSGASMPAWTTASVAVAVSASGQGTSPAVPAVSIPTPNPEEAPRRASRAHESVRPSPDRQRRGGSHRRARRQPTQRERDLIAFAWVDR